MGTVIPIGLEAWATNIVNIGEFATLEQAVGAGFTSVGTGTAEYVAGQLTVIEGGAAAEVVTMDSALVAAQSGASMAATGVTTETASMGLLKTSTGYKACGILAMDVGAVGACVAPLLGVALGAELYESNPKLWTDISQALLPFAYPGTTKIPTFVDIARDAVTGDLTYKILTKLGIVDAIQDVLEENGYDKNKVYYGTTYTNASGSVVVNKVYAYKDMVLAQNPDGVIWKVPANRDGKYLICTVRVISGYNQIDITYEDGVGGMTIGSSFHATTDLPVSTRVIWDTTGMIDRPFDKGYPDGTGHWQGEAVPEIEPYPFPTIVPFPSTEPVPSDPDTEPLVPITPVEPFPLYPEGPPYDPEVEPDNWPEEEPWPTVVPFPWTNPDPDPEEPWPEVIPFPLPEEPPEEWPTEPETWPEPYPDEEPWPRQPDEWPEEVPWPETPPDDWPDDVPWPESPEEWPEEVPWPTPWPENWPEDQPWPIEWPEEIPYPIPNPSPYVSPDPDVEPTPGEVENPDPAPEIEPWIQPQPNPQIETDPQRQQVPEPQADPSQKSDPIAPYVEPIPRDEPYAPTNPDSDPNPDDTPPIQDLVPYPDGTVDVPNIPVVPLIVDSTHGLITVWNPTSAEFLAFANWLWVTYADATIDKIWNNPFDGVIGAFELYCDPTYLGRKNILCGFLDSGIACDYISRYTEINCGTLGIPEFYGNYFDYSPYSKAHIYLPFIGIQELNVDDIVGHYVNVTYRIDEYNGSCIAMITCARVGEVNGQQYEYSNVMYQFSGNCSVELPLTGGSQASIKAGMMTADAYQNAANISANAQMVGGIASAIGGIGSLLTGRIGSGINGIGSGISQYMGAQGTQAYGQAQALSNMLSGKSTVQKSGSFGASHGSLGIKKPFIVVTRPKQIQVSNYNQLYGFPSHKMVTVGTCQGFLRCREVHVVSTNATDEEKSQIESLLKSGVYVTE